MSWFYVAIVVVAIVLSVTLAPKPPSAKPSSISDFSLPTAESGRPIPVVFGTYTVRSPNIVWYGDLAYVAVRTKGGK